MALWKEIRKSINSTLGTKGFKPLDKIIRDSYYVYASDDLLKILYEKSSEPKLETIQQTYIGTVNLSGVLKLRCLFSGEAYYNNSSVWLGVEGNLKQLQLPYDSSENKGYVETEIEVTKGDRLFFALDVISTRDVVQYVKVTANGKIGSAPDTGIFVE